MPNTWNGNKNSWAYYVNKQAIPKDLNTIDGNITITTGMPEKADDNGTAMKQLTAPDKISKRTASSGKLPLYFKVMQISNSVKRENYVLCAKFSYKPSIRKIKRAQKVYSTGDLYLFSFFNGFMLLSMKCFQSKRLQKIYKALGSWSSYNEILKFKQNWIYCGDIKSEKGHEKGQKFGLIDIFEEDAEGHYSNTHRQFLRHFYHKEYPNLIGGSPKAYIAEFHGL